MMFSYFLAVAALLSCISSSCALEQSILTGSPSISNPLNDDFGKLVEEMMEFWKLPGLSVGIVDGEETWAEVRDFTLLES